MRLIRDGVLDPEPIAGVPADILSRSNAGLMEVAVHPDFARNGLVYLGYTRHVEGRVGTVAVVRGRLEGHALVNVEDVFVAEPWGGYLAGTRIVFGTDGSMFVAIGGAYGVERPDRVTPIAAVDGQYHGMKAQDPNSHVGKILRLRPDGSVPADNPFAGRAGYKPEIYSLGHRNQQGMALHPVTGALWAADHGPQGGDELNVIEAGGNYGWPLVSYGRQYEGPRISTRYSREDLIEPFTMWVPSISPSGLTFYTGDRFPAWKGDIFVGSMMTGRIPRTGHLERIALNDAGEEVARESLLTGLRQRIRDVRQGPDGLLYVLTEEQDGALLRLEPVD
ncbi:MAG: PQQ-dependent sugar dehydrogenase [Acidimicrobiia bacterium]|nr:PQQ-dependent sugar dehydrogenase [Acidimicrobiia bacterium]